MGRSRLMTVGVLLVLIGVQLYCVRSYHLSSKAAKFIKQRIIEVEDTVADTSNPAYSNIAYSNQYYGAAPTNPSTSQEITPPSWLKWAALFAGSVLFLQGAAIQRP